MSTPSKDEAIALEKAGVLLRFAAERVKKLDPKLSLVITEAQEAAATNQWTPAIAQRFWGAFATLCDLILPVMLDCLDASQPTIPRRRLFFFSSPGQPRSLAERSCRRYLVVLLVPLAIIIPIQLYLSTCTRLSEKLDESIKADKVMVAQLRDSFNDLETERSKHKDAEWTAEENNKADQIVGESDAVNFETDRLLSQAELLTTISSFGLASFDHTSVPDYKPSTQYWDDKYFAAFNKFNATVPVLIKSQERSDLLRGVIASFILPVLFGTMGAVAYVIRTISDQIRTTTFFSNSPIRHMMRVALGALAGLVIGLFSGLSAQLSLPPLALAFLAGYGVEAVFSTFDAIVARFREAKTEAPAK